MKRIIRLKGEDLKRLGAQRLLATALKIDTTGIGAEEGGYAEQYRRRLREAEGTVTVDVLDLLLHGGDLHDLVVTCYDFCFPLDLEGEGVHALQYLQQQMQDRLKVSADAARLLVNMVFPNGKFVHNK